MELAQLLESEGLDGEEVLSWARERAASLVADLPDDLDLESLLKDLPQVNRAGVREDADLLGDDADEFEALHTGSFDIVEEGVPESHVDFETGPLPEAGAVVEVVEVVESGELEEVDDAELEELEPEELMEFASGEYEIVRDEDGEVEGVQDAHDSRPAAPPPPPPPPPRQAAAPVKDEEPDLMGLAKESKDPDDAVPDALDDPGSFDIDLDL